MALNRREKEKQAARKTDAAAWATNQQKGFSMPALTLPKGVEQFKLEVGVHALDFMPYVVGKGNPRADEGFQHFEREFGTHRMPTADGKSKMYGCIYTNFQKRCPVCQWMNNEGRTADPELLKSLRVSTRHLWCVNDKPGDKKNPIQVMESNHFNRGSGFGEQMADAIIAVPRYGKFSDLEGGLTVQLTVKEQTFPGGKFNMVSRIDFLPRDYSYPESILEQVPCLDDCLTRHTWDELTNVLNQGGDQGDDDEKASSTAKKPATEESDDDPEEPSDVENDDDEKAPTFKIGDAVEYEGEPHTVKKVSSDGTSLTLKDGEGDLVKAVDPDDCTAIEAEDDSDDDEPAPAKGKKKPATSDDEDDDDVEDPSDVEDEDLEEGDSDLEDDDDDDPPPAKRGGKKPKPPADDDEDDSDDDPEEPSELEEDEDDEPEPPKKKKAPAKKGKK